MNFEDDKNNIEWIFKNIQKEIEKEDIIRNFNHNNEKRNVNRTNYKIYLIEIFFASALLKALNFNNFKDFEAKEINIDEVHKFINDYKDILNYLYNFDYEVTNEETIDGKMVKRKEKQNILDEILEIQQTDVFQLRLKKIKMKNVILKIK